MALSIPNLEEVVTLGSALPQWAKLSANVEASVTPELTKDKGAFQPLYMAARVNVPVGGNLSWIRTWLESQDAVATLNPNRLGEVRLSPKCPGCLLSCQPTHEAEDQCTTVKKASVLDYLHWNRDMLHCWQVLIPNDWRVPVFPGLCKFGLVSLDWNSISLFVLE